MLEQIAQYGIIGDPVEHSLSPLMHNTAFDELKLPAEYKLFPVQPDELDAFLKGLKEHDSPVFGLNVTIPYKEKVISYLDNITPFAQKIGAVNTVVINPQRKLIGYNTDAPGFLAHLVELGFKTKDKRIAVLGAGGSARSILATLCMIPERPQSVRIYNRSGERLRRLLDDLGGRIDLSIVEPVNSVDDLNIELADMLINATALGLRPGDPCLIDKDLLHGNMLVYDLIYNPIETPLLRMAKLRGAQASNGLGMLYYQGVLAFQHWTNIQLDDEIKIKMRKSLEEGVRRNGF